MVNYNQGLALYMFYLMFCRMNFTYRFALRYTFYLRQSFLWSWSDIVIPSAENCIVFPSTENDILFHVLRAWVLFKGLLKNCDLTFCFMNAT